MLWLMMALCRFRLLKSGARARLLRRLMSRRVSRRGSPHTETPPPPGRRRCRTRTKPLLPPPFPGLLALATPRSSRLQRRTRRTAGLPSCLPSNDKHCGTDQPIIGAVGRASAKRSYMGDESRAADPKERQMLVLVAWW